MSAAPTAPDAPALLVGGEPWWEACGLDKALIDADWPCIVADDVARARWLATIRRVSLVAIGGDHALRWAAVEAIRPLTDVPIVVFADDPDEVTALLRVGVDAVIATGEPGTTALARLTAVLRGADHRRGPGVRYLRANDLHVDLWTQQCACRGEPLALSPTEYDLLTFLMTRPAVTLLNDTIVRRVWEYPPGDGRNALRIVVNRLRRKLGDDPCNPTYVASVRGRGYRFVANVAEVADSLTEHAMRVDVTPLLESLTTFTDQLATTPDARAAAETLVDLIDRAGLGDGLALFRNDRRRMRLVTSRHMTAAWQESVADGVPLDPSFASAQSVLSGEVVQFADVRAMTGQFGATARQLAGDGFRACHFIPITRAGHTWGHLGVVRRSPSPLDAVTMAYLRSLCATFLLHLADTAAANGVGHALSAC
jgi:DNA-binding response OmpR family regulator